MNIIIQEIKQIELNDIEELLQASIDEGFRHIQRLYDDYRNGKNRFDQAGEALYVAKHENRIIGICGLNQDLHYGKGFGRLRRLYILKEYRRSGIGRNLIDTIIRRAKNHYKTIILKTDNPEAHKFYISLGFSEFIDTDNVTHRIELI